MKLKLWKDNDDEESVSYVRLREERNRVVVCLVDEKGENIERGNLIFLYPRKPLMRASSVSPKSGFPLNARGQIKVNGLSDD